MNLEEHCKRSENLFGDRHEEVHLWLDEYAKNYSNSEKYKHRKYRHHQEGVEEARKIFGDLGAKVAEDHIRADNEGKLPIKKDYEIPEYDE